MTKCMRCGGSFLIWGRVKLKDGGICGKCFKQLGFDGYDKFSVKNAPYEEIKNGSKEYLWIRLERRSYEEAKETAIEYGISADQALVLNENEATNMEYKIFSMICALLRDEARDPDMITLSSSDARSFMASIDGTVFIRFKAADSVKWITLENESGDKIRIAGAARLNTLSDRIVKAYDSAL